MPWWLSATARTIESPSPEEPERSPWARKKRSKTLSCSSAGMPGPSSSTASTMWPLERSTRRLDRGPGVGVAQRVLHQVEHEPVQLVLHAFDLGARGRRDRDLVVARDRLELGGGRRRRRWRGRPCARGGSRPASARASSSRSATSRRIRRLERSAEAAASRCSPSQRLLEQLEVGQHRGQRRAQLVRGVGDELALARERGLGLRRAPRRARAASTPAWSPARRPRRRPPGAGSCSAGSRVRSISRAASVSSAIGSIARRAVARPASSASAAPPSTPRPRNSFTRLAVDARRRSGARTGPRACSRCPAFEASMRDAARASRPSSR